MNEDDLEIPAFLRREPGKATSASRPVFKRAAAPKRKLSSVDRRAIEALRDVGWINPEAKIETLSEADKLAIANHGDANRRHKAEAAAARFAALKEAREITKRR